MKKDDVDEEMKPEYQREDLGPGMRAKYQQAYAEGTNLIILDPDVAKAFPSGESVNEALRSLMDIAQRSVKPVKPSSRRAKAHG